MTGTPGRAAVNEKGRWTRDLALARAAAREAGEVVMRHFRRLEEVSFKSDDQPVTVADLEADRLLKDRLLADRPEYGWLSEETADSPDRLRRHRVWIVDPVDGTNSFVLGLPEFVVSVGLVEEGRVVAAVVHNPATGELFDAVLGGGAHRDGVPIRVARPPAPGEPWRLLASRSEIERGGLAAYGGEWNVIPLGSTAYRMVKIADGTGHAFASHGIKYEWDVCAATLILREAGGEVGTTAGEPLVFNRAAPRFGGIVAACARRLPPPLADAFDGRPQSEQREREGT